jgi:GT2 family glycosyltransferase
MPKPLAIVPSYPTQTPDLELLDECLKSLRESAGDGLDILLVDDASPDVQLQGASAQVAKSYDADVHINEENSGFSASVNVGLQRALDEGRDAILVNADLSIMPPYRDWLGYMVNQQGLATDGPAWVVGGLLCYPSGLIQHGGIYFSLLNRQFDHLWRFAPMNLPIAQEPTTCPVTGALQFIRHEALVQVGIYDESFRMGYEDVDFCIRVFLAKHECVYQPKVRAWHHESVFRGRWSENEKLARWQGESFVRLMEKYRDQSFAGLVPFL